MTKTIAFDTSNQPLSVALIDAGSVIAQIETNISRNHSEQLLPAIDQLVADAGWHASDLERVIVSAGPGSYTGLRIGVTTAKTLAYTLGLELAGVSSLALLAANEMDSKAVIVPVMDARNDNLYTAAYQWIDGNMVVNLSDQHSNFEKLVGALQELSTDEIVFVGEFERFKERLQAQFPSARFSEDNLPHAGKSLAVLNPEKILTKTDDIHQFVPNYHRLSQAEADWARVHPEGEATYVERV